MANTIDTETREVLDLIRADPELRPVLQALEEPDVYTSGGRINRTGLARRLGVRPTVAVEWLVYLQATTRKLSGDLVEPVRPRDDLQPHRATLPVRGPGGWRGGRKASGTGRASSATG